MQLSCVWTALGTALGYSIEAMAAMNFHLPAGSGRMNFRPL